MQAYYDKQPKELQTDPSNSTLYRWDIESYENEEGETKWQCNEVRIYVTPTIDNIKKAIIAESYPSDIEAKLQNDNMESIINTGDPTEEYQDFLIERKRLKECVNAYFVEEPNEIG